MRKICFITLLYAILFATLLLGEGKQKESLTLKDFNLLGKVKTIVETKYETKEVNNESVKDTSKSINKKEWKFDSKGRLLEIIYYRPDIGNGKEIFNYDESGNYTGYAHYNFPDDLFVKTVPVDFDENGKVIKEKCYNNDGNEKGLMSYIWIDGIRMQRIWYEKPYLAIYQHIFNFHEYEESLITLSAYAGNTIERWQIETKDSHQNWIKAIKTFNNLCPDREQDKEYTFIVERKFQYY